MATNPFFNTAYYYQNNKDVYASGMDAYAHYLEYGAVEALEGAAGRKPAPWFDIDFYYENNPDLIAAKLTAPELFQHFTTYGYKEGRAPNAAAEQNVNADSLLAYALANPDLLEAFGIEADATELTDAQFADLSFQYFAYGYNEDRPALPSDQVTDVDAPGPTLTVGKDYIEVEGDNNVISAPVEQNLLGAVTNTLETGDVILGAEGSTGNRLEADLAISISGTQIVAPAISATTKNIDVVELRAQTDNDDWANSAQGNDSHIDAEKFEGVKEWWSTNSRATIQIEDVRTAPEDTTIGLKNSDPFVGFNVYFDPQQLSADTVASNSNLTLTLVDNQNPGSLVDVPVNGLSFKLGGESFTLQSEAMGDAKDYAEFDAALQAALADVEGLEGVTAKLNADNTTITLNDPEGREFATGGWKFIDDEVPAQGTLTYDQVVGAPDVADELISTNVVLDNVGRTSRGGTVDIGSLGDGGVEEFNVQVGATSWVASLESNSFLGDGAAFLEVVNVAHADGANGDLTIGRATVSTDDRVTTNGLTDVRELDAEGFSGDITAGIRLTGNSIGRYLEDAELEGDETVDFNYTTGSGSDNLSIDVDSDLTQDGDFALNVDLGAGDDRLNLDLNGGKANNVSVDGGEGKNTIELTSSQGTNAGNTFKDFANFQDYVVAGAVDYTVNNNDIDTTSGGNTTHVFGADSGVTGVESVVVATGAPKQPVFNATGDFVGYTTTSIPGGDTTLVNLEADTSVTISGENQTLGNNNSNDNQTFGNININNAAAAALEVDLANSARNGGVGFGHLAVEALNIDNDPDVKIADTTTRTLDLVSSGQRATTNEVTAINAKFVNTFNITGTQNLTAAIKSAANSGGKKAEVSNFVVDASDLTANVKLEVAANIIDNIAKNDRTTTITGAEGAGDALTLAGVDFDTKDSVTVSGFETINFDLTAESTYNAVKTTGVEQYNIKSTDTKFDLTNLADNANVNINTTKESSNPDPEYDAGVSGEINLAGQGGTVNVQLSPEDQFASIDTTGLSKLNINGYSTINLDLNNKFWDGNKYVAGKKQEYKFTLATDADGESVAKTLVLTGGNAEAKNGAVDATNNSLVDSVELTSLNNSFTTIDISGYAGKVTGSMEKATDATKLSNVKVVVGARDMEWNVREDSQTLDNITYNTTFKFTEAGTTSTKSVWQIDNFIPANEGGNPIPLTKHSVLALKDLGVTSYTDLDVEYTPADAASSAEAYATITSKEQKLASNETWEIKLLGVTNGQLGVDVNFDFVS